MAASGVEELRRQIGGQADASERLERLEMRLDALCRIFEVLLTRGRGRPSQAEAAELESLKAQANGETH